jgi:hypothetical protein
MRRISEVGERQYAWTQTGCRYPEYELWAEDEIVGTLCWQRGSLAVAETADGRWSFKRPGFGRSRVSVREVGSHTDIAASGSGWTGSGTLQLSAGRRFHWSAANLWHSQWVWQQANGTPLVRFESKQRIVKVEGRVTIERAALPFPELDLLVALGWYLLVGDGPTQEG